MDGKKSERTTEHTTEQITERTTGDALLDVIQLEDVRQDAEDRYIELHRAFMRGEITPQEYHYQRDLFTDYLMPKIGRDLKTLTGEINIPENGVSKQQTKLGRFVTKLLRRG